MSVEEKMKLHQKRVVVIFSPVQMAAAPMARMARPNR